MTQQIRANSNKITSRLGLGFKELRCDRCSKLIGYISRKYYFKHSYRCPSCYITHIQEDSS